VTEVGTDNVSVLFGASGVDSPLFGEQLRRSPKLDSLHRDQYKATIWIVVVMVPDFGSQRSRSHRTRMKWR